MLSLDRETFQACIMKMFACAHVCVAGGRLRVSRGPLPESCTFYFWIVFVVHFAMSVCCMEGK